MQIKITEEKIFSPFDIIISVQSKEELQMLKALTLLDNTIPSNI